MPSHYRYIGLLLLVCLFASCRPKDVLPKKEMMDLLYEIHMTEAMTDGMYGPLPNQWSQGLDAEYFRDLSYRSVLRKHRVTEARFFKSVAYYSKNLRTYSRMYEKIGKRLDAYIQSIQEAQTVGSFSYTVEQLIVRDSAKTKNWYERFMIRPDTAKLTHSYCLDSVREWAAGRWLRRPLLKPKPNRKMSSVPMAASPAQAATPAQHPAVKPADTMRSSQGIIIRNEKGQIIQVQGRQDPTQRPDAPHFKD